MRTMQTLIYINLAYKHWTLKKTFSLDSLKGAGTFEGDTKGVGGVSS